MIKSIKKAMDILCSFTYESPEITVTQTSRRLSLSKSTVSRILSDLERHNLICRAPYNGYRIGSKILELANIYQATTNWLEVARPHMRDLQRRTGQSVSVFILDGEQRICIGKLESSHEVRQVLTVGSRYPLHAGAPGKVILAYLPTEKREQILIKTGLPKFTPSTITNVRMLDKELMKIRKNGYAVSLEERVPLIASVSAPIRGYNGEIIAALCLSGLSIHFLDSNLSEFARLTKTAANKMSEQLGYNKTPE